MKIIDVSRPPKEIWLGRDGENNWRPIAFECASLLAKRPDGIITVWMEANGNKFPLSADMDGTKAVWYPQQEELFLDGSRIEVSIQSGEDVGTSAIIGCKVDESLIGNGEHPAQEMPPWGVNVVAETKENADRAEEATEHYPKIVNGNWYVWDVTNFEWVDTGFSARGPAGDTGDSAYEEAVVFGFVGTEAEWLASLKGERGETGPQGPHGVQGPKGDPGDDYVLTPQDKVEIAGMVPVPTVPTEEISANTASRHTHENKAVLDDITAEKVQSWDGKGTYSKPSGGIPASDLASGVIPTVPQLATVSDMSDWTSGKTVDAATLATNFLEVLQTAEEDAQSVLPTDTASGAIASFPDGAGDAAVKSLVATIKPVQSGSGDPSPDNVRPITGFTGCAVTRTGKNLLPPFAQASATTNGVTLTNENGEYTLNGTATARASFDILVNLPAGVYTLSVNNDAIANGSVYVMSDANTVAENISLSSANKVQTFTVASRIERIRITVARDSVLTNVKLSPVITSGSTAATATDYEPYQGDTYNITFPSEAGTVYGGTLDVTNGVLTVTKGLIPSYSGEALPGEWISSMDVYAQGVTPTTGAQVCYDLASPATYQLDPVTITTLLGVNSIWADTGDVAVDYRADTGLYIQKLTGSTEEDMIADAPIASGKYFLVGNTLYLSTAAIAAGATLTPGTNCVKTNLAEALNALNKTATVPSAESNSFGGGA